MRAQLAGLALCTLLAAGCQAPDVGQPCNFDLLSASSTISADFLETGKTECENLVCIVSPAPSASADPKKYPLCTFQNGSFKCPAYCSKACASDSQCFTGDTGLVCRSVLIDPDQIAKLPPDQQAAYAKYLGDMQFSKYCALPAQ